MGGGEGMGEWGDGEMRGCAGQCRLYSSCSLHCHVLQSISRCNVCQCMLSSPLPHSPFPPTPTPSTTDLAPLATSGRPRLFV
jgi:hypothetical protein